MRVWCGGGEEAGARRCHATPQPAMSTSRPTHWTCADRGSAPSSARPRLPRPAGPGARSQPGAGLTFRETRQMTSEPLPHGIHCWQVLSQTCVVFDVTHLWDRGRVTGGGSAEAP